MTSLPALTGSEKQIAWAGKLRDSRLAEVRKHLGTSWGLGGVSAAVKHLGYNVPADLLAIHARIGGDKTMVTGAIIAALEAETSASWWIDERDDVVFVTIAATARRLAA